MFSKGTIYKGQGSVHRETKEATLLNVPRILVLVRYGGSTDQEITAIEKTVTHSSQEEGACHIMDGHTG